MKRSISTLFRAFAAWTACAIAAAAPAQNARAQETHCAAQQQIVTPRILNGRAARFEEAPYQVYIMLRSGSICGGAFLSRTYVVTAAHCVTDNARAMSPAEITLGYGSVHVSALRRADVARVIVHPGYAIGDTTSPNDIAILQLRAPADICSGYRVVPARPGWERRFAAEGMLATASGFGLMAGFDAAGRASNAPRRRRVASSLQIVNLPIVSRSVCQDAYLRYPERPTIHDSMLCAGYADGRADACRGDSGGALVVQGGPYRLLVGIVSWGPEDCGAAESYGVYTRVSSYFDWIMDVTGATRR